MQDKIIDLLAKGLSGVEIAKATGVTEGYVSQVSNDPDARAKINELRSKHIGDHVKLDDAYDRIELAGTERLLKLVEEKGQLLDPMKLLKIVATANTAKRRLDTNPGQQAGQGNSFNVILNFPNVPMRQLSLVKSANNEVLEVGGQQLLTMPTGLVKQRALQRQDIDSI
jgi:transcriptional regulator with XRE-family HTH domain